MIPSIPGSKSTPPPALRESLLSALILVALSSCAALRPASTPMPFRVLAPSSSITAPSCLVVLLPGIRDSPADFDRFEFADEVLARYPAAKVVAVDAHLGYYRKRTVLERIRADVIDPFVTSHPETPIVAAGVSLGGLGSLLLRRDHADIVDVAVPLAPFLGEADVVAELRAAAGVRDWRPTAPIAVDDGAREAWLAFSEELRNRERLGDPVIYLGVGSDDDFAAANRFLAAVLPEGRFFEVEGGHDWKTWQTLWRLVINAGALDVCSQPSAADPG